MPSPASVPSIARALGRLARALYPGRAVPDRTEIGAFIDDAIEDAWRTRRWRGLVAVAGALVLDLARAWAGRPAPPITNHGPTHHPAGRRTLMDRWLRDLRDGFRSLRHAPTFTTVAVLTLALGIGATTAVYAVVDGAILRPFPYPDMDRLVVLSEVAPNGSPMSVSWPNFVDWEAQNQVFDELGLYRAASVSLIGEGAPDRLNGHLVSSAVFTSIGIQPLSGRVFGKADDVPGAERVAIIREQLWRGRFAGRADIVGHRVTLNDEPMSEYVAQQTEQPRLNATLVTGFAAVALHLAATGVYGVLSYIVSQRTREIGVRLALGARCVDIMRDVAGQGFVVALSGLVLGLIVAAIAACAIRAVLVSVSPSDATTFVLVGVLLLAVGALASLIPARRASGIDPLKALRSE